MSNRKTMGVTLLVVGAVLLIGSFTADMIGIGVAPGIGYKQIIGAVAGAVIAVAGFILYSRK